MKPYLKRGGYNAICDGCGFQFKNTQLRRRWDGIMTCEKCFEVRHPMEFIKGTKDSFALPWTRPLIPPKFIPENWESAFSETVEVHDFGVRFVNSIYIRSVQSGIPFNDLMFNAAVFNQKKNRTGGSENVVFLSENFSISHQWFFSDTVAAVDAKRTETILGLADTLNSSDSLKKITNRLSVAESTSNVDFYRAQNYYKYSDSVIVSDTFRIAGTPKTSVFNVNVIGTFKFNGGLTV